MQKFNSIEVALFKLMEEMGEVTIKYLRSTLQLGLFH